MMTLDELIRVFDFHYDIASVQHVKSTDTWITKAILKGMWRAEWEAKNLAGCRILDAAAQKLK